MKKGLTYIEVNKKNRKNKLVTVVLILIDIFIILAVLGSLFGENGGEGYFSNLIALAVFGFITYERIKGQGLNASLEVVKDFEKSDVISSLEKEVFSLEYTLGNLKFYRGERWINISNLFIPKSFLKHSYVSIGMHRVYTVKLLLLTGRCIDIRVGGANKDLENTLNALKRCMPRFKLSNTNEGGFLMLQREYINSFTRENYPDVF